MARRHGLGLSQRLALTVLEQEKLNVVAIRSISSYLAPYSNTLHGTLVAKQPGSRARHASLPKEFETHVWSYIVHNSSFSSNSSPPSKTDKSTTPAPQLPDAEDCDEALKSYQSLRSQLDKLEKPSSYKTASGMARDAVSALYNALLALGSFTFKLPVYVFRIITMSPSQWKQKFKNAGKIIKHEAHHYWVGTKLLVYEVRIASRIAVKAAQGSTLTRRERTQLTRTTADVFRLVPFAVIVAIPFLELALPLLLRLFPNLLPSTYEDKLKKEEELKRRIAARMEIARFLQETVTVMAKDLSRRGGEGSKATARELVEFMNKVRAGERVENHDLVRFAQLFNDELTLDNLERVQVVMLCQFVGLAPYGTDEYLKAKLRAHLREIKRDDKDIQQEGIENLTEDELRQACKARGMRALFGEGAAPIMRRQLREWLDLSLHRGLPSSLLLLSRAFTITQRITDAAEKKDAQYRSLKETLSVIPDEAVESVKVEQLAPAAGPEALEARLAQLRREEELIREENAQAAAAASPEPREPFPPASESELLPADQHSPHMSDMEPMSGEERQAKLAEVRQRKLHNILSALLDMASGSAVAKERAMFMDLVEAEMERVTDEMRCQGGQGGALMFTGKGMEAQHANARESEEAAESLASHRLSQVVSKMLHGIELELDKVEQSIGKSMHVLDLDNDGLISRQELVNALKFLREQMSDDELQLLFESLRQAGQDGISVGSLMAKLEAARERQDRDEEGGGQRE